MDESTRHFIDSLDDEALEHRIYMLDTHEDGSTEVVCSELLTERAAMTRMVSCSKSRRPMVVEEYLMNKYRELEPGGNVSSSIFTSHSTLGTVGMLWELLARARDKREGRR